MVVPGEHLQAGVPSYETQFVGFGNLVASRLVALCRRSWNRKSFSPARITARRNVFLNESALFQHLKTTPSIFTARNSARTAVALLESGNCQTSLRIF